MLRTARRLLRTPTRPGAQTHARVERVESRLLFATFVVTNDSDSGANSLRQAIIAANTNGNPAEEDVIQFQITTGAQTVKTINLLSALPAITEPVLIDATTQPGWVAAPIVELNGAGAGAGADGLVIQTPGTSGTSTVVTGLAINRFSGNGVRITGSYNIINDCYIGTDPTGTVDRGNVGRGVLIDGGGSHNAVGSSIIAFNDNDGVAVASGLGNNFGNTRIFANAGLAIDLGPDGPTPNDTLDGDTGANNLQNTPLLTSITYGNGEAFVSGSINTTPNTNLLIDFFTTNVQVAEGRTDLNTHLDVVTDASGNATFSNVSLPGVTTTDFVTATAMPYARGGQEFPFDTSEFSAPLRAGTGTPPLVQQVYVRGSAWTGPYLQSLATNGTGSAAHGFRVQGGAEQHNELPWGNLNQVRVQFTEDVSIQAADVALATSSPTALTVSSLTYDSGTFTVTLNLSRALANEKVTVTLDGDPGGVTGTDAAADPLDGEWANPTATNPPAGGRSYPSGNGTAGGDFSFSLRSLPGDFNRDGAVNLADFGTLRQNFGTGGFVRSVLQGDANGDGNTNLADFGILRGSFGRTTPL